MLGNPVATKKLLKLDYISDDRVYTCNSNVQVNDLVYFDVSEVIQRSTNNDNATLPVIGIVRSKVSDTECLLQFTGERTGFSGIVPNQRYYLSTNGAITATAPSTSGTAIVPIGIGKNTGTIELRLSLQLIKN